MTAWHRGGMVRQLGLSMLVTTFSTCWRTCSSGSRPQSACAAPHLDHRQAAPSGRQSTGLFPRQGAHLALDLRGKAKSSAQ